MPNTLHSTNRFIPCQVSSYQHPPLIRNPFFLQIRTPTFPSTHYPFLPSFLPSSILPPSFVACQLILSLPHFITPENAHLHHALCTSHCLNIHLYAVMQATYFILITSHADYT